jgi:hypothetical protein
MAWCCLIEPHLTKREPDRLAAWAGGVNFYQCCLAGGAFGLHRRQVTQVRWAARPQGANVLSQDEIFSIENKE